MRSRRRVSALRLSVGACCLTWLFVAAGCGGEPREVPDVVGLNPQEAIDVARRFLRACTERLTRVIARCLRCAA